MGRSEYDPRASDHKAWNAGKLVGAKRALKPQQVWAIRFLLDREKRVRDSETTALGHKMQVADIRKTASSGGKRPYGWPRKTRLFLKVPSNSLRFALLALWVSIK